MVHRSLNNSEVKELAIHSLSQIVASVAAGAVALAALRAGVLRPAIARGVVRAVVSASGVDTLEGNLLVRADVDFILGETEAPKFDDLGIL